MIGCESKNEHKKSGVWKRLDYMCSKFLTILDAMVNKTGGPYTIIW